MMSFDFVFILHVMKELMGITNLLCKKLQQKSQDIVNAMDDVATTKKLIQNLRDHGWSSLISDVTSFCKKQDIAIPDLNVFYAYYIRSRAQNELTVEHHYRYDIFTVAVDQQLHELNSRFSEQATDFLFCVLLWILRIRSVHSKLMMCACWLQSSILLISQNKKWLI